MTLFLPPLPMQGNTVESEHLSELTEEEYEAHYIRRQDLKGFVWLDAKYLNPFFTRRLTQEVGLQSEPHSQGPLAFPSGPAGATGGVGSEGPCAMLGSGVQPGPLLLLSFPSSPGSQAACAVGFSICCFSFAAIFSASLIIDL